VARGQTVSAQLMCSNISGPVASVSALLLDQPPEKVRYSKLVLENERKAEVK